VATDSPLLQSRPFRHYADPLLVVEEVAVGDHGGGLYELVLGVNYRGSLADNHGRSGEETRGDSAPEEQAQQAMIVVVALTLAVPFVLMWVYIATRGYDDGERQGGSGWTILEALLHFLSWW
jgi:hypothetical protein